MTVQPKHPIDLGKAVPPVPRPKEKAHIIKTDAEAIETAGKLAEEFRQGAAERDRERIWPQAELDKFSQSGLWSINVPKAHAGRNTPRLRTHNQKMTVAAMQMALMKVWAQRSYRVAMRRQSLSLPNMRSMRLRCL